MNNDAFRIGYETGETDAKNGAEPMVFDFFHSGDFMAGYEMAYYNKTKEKKDEL